MKITISHEFDQSADDFFRYFFDEAEMSKMYRDFMGFPEFAITQREEGRILRRTISAIPKMEMPGAVAKLLGSNFRYVEEGTFDRDTKIFTWKTTPSMLGDKIKNEGTMRVEVLGPKRIRRVAEVVLEVKVFGVGGMLESTLEKTIRDSWDRASEYFRLLAARG